MNTYINLIIGIGFLNLILIIIILNLKMSYNKKENLLFSVPIIFLILSGIVALPASKDKAVINDNRKSEVVRTSKPPKATVVHWYDKAKIKSVNKVNSTQYKVELKNGNTLYANKADGNPPTNKLLQAKRPMVMVSNYWTSYMGYWGFEKYKLNQNVTIYFDD